MRPGVITKMSNVDEVAKAFVQFYYQTFMANRPGLEAVYHANSMMTFEGQQVLGAKAIAEKLAVLPSAPNFNTFFLIFVFGV